MIKQTALREALKQNFPQFGDKSTLIDYFVSFDFPEKQKKMVYWWQRVIEFIMEYHQKVYINYQDLVNYVSFYNLKPTPLKAVIDYLANKDVFTAENEMQVKIMTAQTKKDTNKSWFNSILSLVSNKQEKAAPVFTYNGKEKIFSKKLKELKKEQIKKQLHVFFGDHLKSLNQFKLAKQLEGRVSLDIDSIRELLKQLSLQGTINISSHNQKSFVLFSVNPNDLTSKEWNELETMKHSLRQQIQKFEAMMARQEDKICKLREKARQQAVNGNANSAKASLREVLESDKKFSSISTRKNMLANQLTQLQYNEMNKSTISLLEQAQSIYQQTMIDSNRLDQVIQKNMEIEQVHKETNQKLEVMVERDDDDEEDVEKMMRQLERQVGLKKRPEKKEVSVKVVEESEPMDIEGQQKQHHFN